MAGVVSNPCSHRQGPAGASVSAQIATPRRRTPTPGGKQPPCSARSGAFSLPSPSARRNSRRDRCRDCGERRSGAIPQPDSLNSELSIGANATPMPTEMRCLAIAPIARKRTTNHDRPPTERREPQRVHLRQPICRFRRAGTTGASTWSAFGNSAQKASYGTGDAPNCHQAKSSMIAVSPPLRPVSVQLRARCRRMAVAKFTTRRHWSKQ